MFNFVSYGNSNVVVNGAAVGQFKGFSYKYDFGGKGGGINININSSQPVTQIANGKLNENVVSYDAGSVGVITQTSTYVPNFSFQSVSVNVGGVSQSGPLPKMPNKSEGVKVKLADKVSSSDKVDVSGFNYGQKVSSSNTSASDDSGISIKVSAGNSLPLKSAASGFKNDISDGGRGTEKLLAVSNIEAPVVGSNSGAKPVTFDKVAASVVNHEKIDVSGLAQVAQTIQPSKAVLSGDMGSLSISVGSLAMNFSGQDFSAVPTVGQAFTNDIAA
ncbi:hypothetical protein P3C24_26650 [Pseudomonas proteolytica]|uniref:M10 family metallopeptidase C-terminal domain-containing protein n=1 Tax=Pseudomonas proteolytica TaxID=219574 RepID=UPI0023DFB1E8|nr:M10 family metallopeptidase C-terminal domain-containing protein [Pseudomonas proteolytica]MDF3164518.1 hypothetical protein [Pseudomonas proteolytica]